MRANIVEVNGRDIEITRIDNDVNGNPRYVVHFIDIANTYIEAINIAKQIGGKKYRAKWFGGGIVFSSYNVKEDLKIIIK